MTEWLQRIDPTLLVGLLVGVGTYLWNSVKGGKVISARGILDSLVTQVINMPGTGLDNVKSRVEAKAREALAKLGIKGSVAEMLVHEAVEAASAKLHEKFDLVERNMNAMVEAASKVTEAFTPKGDMPKLDITLTETP
jgi:hypothetical protein